MMDEAFLRRIQTKIKVDFVTPEQFLEIFRRVCAQFKLKYDASVADDLIRLISDDYREHLRACYPRDIVQQILWKSQYLQKKPQVDRVAITQACQNYFLSL
jgi:hypothetical protein